jgi:chromosome segregation ATPase
MGRLQVEITRLRGALAEREGLLEEYEGRLEGARRVMADKDEENRGVKEQLSEMYERWTEERERAARDKLRVTQLEREIKAVEVRERGEGEDRVRKEREEWEKEERRLSVKVRELEKRLEVMKINYEERLNLALDQKDKEFSQLQEKIHTLQFQHQSALSEFD